MDRESFARALISPTRGLAAAIASYRQTMSDYDAWRSAEGQQNALALRAKYGAGLFAIGEYDRIGHLLLHRAGDRPPATRFEEVVGIAVLRRAVTLFTGIRTLLEASLPDVAKAPARAYFELWLNHQCLAYGGTYPVALETPTSSVEREPRARRYHVAAQRRGLRSRAIALSADSPYPPPTEQDRANLRAELLAEIDGLQTEFPEEWAYFGDVSENSLLKHIGGRDEPAWFAAEFPNRRVNTVAQLASAFGQKWEYDVLYDALSALVHSRGTGHDLTIESDTAAIHHPHDPTWFEMIAWFVTGWHLMFLMTAAKWHSSAMVPQLQTLHIRHRDALQTLQPHTIPNLLG